MTCEAPLARVFAARPWLSVAEHSWYKTAMRYRLLPAILTALVVITWLSDAQAQGRLPRVGVLWPGPLRFALQYVTVGSVAMRGAGWIQRQKFDLVYRFAPPA